MYTFKMAKPNCEFSPLRKNNANPAHAYQFTIYI